MTRTDPRRTKRAGDRRTDHFMCRCGAAVVVDSGELAHVADCVPHPVSVPVSVPHPVPVSVPHRVPVSVPDGTPERGTSDVA